jgi:hypothetical protein
MMGVALMNLNEFRGQPPEIALEQAKHAVETEDPHFHFFYGAYWATYNATQDFVEGTRDWKLKWTEVATTLRQHLYRTRTTSMEDIEIDDMRMRFNLIVAFGVDVNHPLLNPQIILDWFDSKFKTSPQEAMQAIGEKEPDWNLDDLRYVRRIRNRVKFLVYMRRIGIDLSPLHHQWTDLVPTLPQLEQSIVMALKAGK